MASNLHTKILDKGKWKDDKLLKPRKEKGKSCQNGKSFDKSFKAFGYVNSNKKEKKCLMMNTSHDF